MDLKKTNKLLGIAQKVFPQLTESKLLDFMRKGEILDEGIVIILNLRISDKAKRILLCSQESIDSANDIKRISNYLAKSRISEIDQEKILISPKLRKYAKYFSITDDKVLANRELFDLNSIESMMNHIMHADKKGSSLGCGCMICVERHKEYLASLKENSYRNEENRLRAMSDLLEAMQEEKNTYKGQKTFIDPFAHEFFSRNLTVFVKESKKVVIKKNVFYHPKSKETETEYLTARRMLPGDNFNTVLKRLEKSKKHLQRLTIAASKKRNTYSTRRKKTVALICSPF